MSVSPFHLSKTILISYTHRNVKVFTATRQNKSFEDSAAEIFVQQNVHKTTTKIIIYFFKEWSHNIYNMFYL